MPSMFQQVLSATGPAMPIEQRAVTVREDDEVALGCECAYPALQFERWEPEFAAAPLRMPGLSSNS